MHDARTPHLRPRPRLDEAVWRPVIERLGDVAPASSPKPGWTTPSPPSPSRRWSVGEIDVLTPPALAEELRDGISGATLHVIPGSGHLPPIERPDAVAALLRAWLR